VLGGNVNNNNGGGNGTGSSGASNGTLPRTGSDSLPLAAFGTALIVAGGVVLLRRRTLHGT
jgi:LPXTG-motif cell wall-anchored protein